MNNVFVTDGPFPPSLEHMPLLAFITVAALWMGTWLLLQWVYRTVSDMVDHPMPLASAATAGRIVKLVLVFGGLLQAVPRLSLVMAWHTLSPAARVNLSLASWLVFIPWAIMLTIVWWLDRYAKAKEYTGTGVRYQRIYPMPAIAWRMEKSRALVIVLAIAVVSFATTFVRPAPNVPAHVGTRSR